MDQTRRKHHRLIDFDYTTLTAYFVTICTNDRTCVFGTIADGLLRPSRRGLVAGECWRAIPAHHPHVEIDNFAVMPNHVHGILRFVGATHASPSSVTLRARSLRAVIGSYKSAVSKEINRLRSGAANDLWQRNYYDHVIRNDRAYAAIWQYIDDNPSRWHEDDINPDAVRPIKMNSWLESLQTRSDDACVAPTER